MINVSEETKTAYKVSTPKEIVLNFPNYEGGLEIRTGNMGLENFEFSQILEKENFLTFTGCNASQLKVTIARMPVELKGQYVEASIQAGNTDVIPLFKGYVDSQTIKNYLTSTSDIVSYDILYTLSSVDIAQWYINLWSNVESITLRDFRDGLFEYLGLSVVATNLPNDGLEFVKQYSPIQMNALDTIRAICQINGVYGLINRYGSFEFRVLPKISGTNYPIVPRYKSLSYQRWSVVGINKVTVRQSEDVAGGSYGGGSNNYIVQNNIFTLGLDDETLAEIAENIYPNVEGRPYIPYNAEVQGYPWVEVGDIQTYKVYDYTDNSYTNIPYYVMNRSLKGIQALLDTQGVEGEQYRTVFISNLNTQIDTIKDQIESIVGKLSSLSLQYVMFYNDDAITIADGQRKAIASTAFGLARASQIHIEMEYLLICTTEDAVEVTMLYELDGTFIDSRQPIETFSNGKHVFSTYYVVDIPDTTTHTWRVFLECDGGSVRINKLQAQNTILGLGTISGDVWDGTIKVEEEFEPFSQGNYIGTFTDSAQVEFRIPPTPTIIESVPALTLGAIFSGYSESVSFASITDNYTLDTTKTTTHSAKFVKTSTGKFELQTTWSVNGEGVTIDSGYCMKVTPDITDIDVESVVVE